MKLNLRFSKFSLISFFLPRFSLNFHRLGLPVKRSGSNEGAANSEDPLQKRLKRFGGATNEAANSGEDPLQKRLKRFGGAATAVENDVNVFFW